MARGDVGSEIPPFRKWALRTHQCERCDSKSSQPGDERPFFCGELATWIVPIMGIKHGKTWQQSNMAKRLSSRNSEMFFVQKAKTYEFRKKNVDPFVTEKHPATCFPVWLIPKKRGFILSHFPSHVFQLRAIVLGNSHWIPSQDFFLRPRKS